MTPIPRLLLWSLTLVLPCALQSFARKTTPSSFKQPPSRAVDAIDPYVAISHSTLPQNTVHSTEKIRRLVGNGGYSPDGSGGMIPSTAPPFAMTRWVAQTRQNYVSVTPYNYTDTTIHGFQGTHQPAIWMGESGQIVIAPGAGDVKSTFNERGLAFSHNTEIVTASYYSVDLEAGAGKIHAEQTASMYFTLQRYILPYEDEQRPELAISASRSTKRQDLIYWWKPHEPR